MRLPQGTKTLNRGGYRVFQKGGLRPAIRNAGRGGGGGGAVRFRPDTKSGGGGCGCLAEEGALPYMKGGVATPKPPPSRLDPPLLKKGSAFENRYALCCYEPEMTLKTRPAYKR